MPWLVTRPRPDAEALARQLRGLGHGAIVSPMMQVVPRPLRPVDWSGVDAIVFTSRNAVIHGGPFPSLARSLPVFTVGDATAAAARAAGFGAVTSAHGNVDDLMGILKTPRPGGDAARYVHFCGQDTKTDLGTALAATGASVENAVVYAMTPAKTFTPEALTAFRAGTLDGAIFLSPRTAAIFAELAGAAKLGPLADGFVLAVISPATAAALSGLGGRTKVAERPDLASVLTLLG